MKLPMHLRRAATAALPVVALCWPQAGWALTVKEAVAAALKTNPEVGQAIENREAIEFEMEQARGLYLPSVDLEASAGVRRLDSPSRRALGIEGDTLNNADVSLSVTQKLFDSGARRAEVDRQAARIDGASFRVLERSQLIALAAVQDYLEFMLQSRVVADTAENVRFHQSILGEIGEGIEGGALNEADRQQAQERLFAAKARNTQALGDLEEAKIRFFKTTGVPLTSPVMPKSLAASLPRTLETAIDLARNASPSIKAAAGDVDAASANIRAARSKYGPEVLAEAVARSGSNVDGDEGESNDLQAMLVLRWNLYRGGIDRAHEQETIRRASEQRLKLHQVYNEIEETVRTSWDRRFRQADLAKTLRSQSATNNKLVASYREQFKVGQRSLLDVLDAQNTRFNTKILADTSVFASLLAEYRLLATTGQLLDALGVSAPEQADSYARAEFNTPSAPAGDDYARLPSRQTNDLPLDLLAPIRKTK
ncbi:MAG: TolC family outer membrane protein [Mesorhizobium sp.]